MKIIQVDSTNSIENKKSDSRYGNQYIRLQPVIQFVPSIDSSLSERLTVRALQKHQSGGDIFEVCRAMKNLAHSLGYKILIRVQGIESKNMPSCPKKTVLTALILVDICRFERQTLSRSAS